MKTMKQVTLFKTSDEKFHYTAQDAIAHATTRYEDHLGKLVDQIFKSVDLAKNPAEARLKLHAALDQHLNEFAKAAALKQDITLEPKDNDEQ